MTDAMDVDLPQAVDLQVLANANLPSNDMLRIAQTDDMALVYVLRSLAIARSGYDSDLEPSNIVQTEIFDAIKRLKMYDLRPLLASGKYNEVASRVQERISFSE